MDLQYEYVIGSESFMTKAKVTANFYHNECVQSRKSGLGHVVKWTYLLSFYPIFQLKKLTLSIDI